MPSWLCFLEASWPRGWKITESVYYWNPVSVASRLAVSKYLVYCLLQWDAYGKKLQSTIKELEKSLCLALESRNWFLQEMLQNMSFRRGLSIPELPCVLNGAAVGKTWTMNPHIIPGCPVIMAERSRFGVWNSSCQMGVWVFCSWISIIEWKTTF